jgi:hypothetical protein
MPTDLELAFAEADQPITRDPIVGKRITLALIKDLTARRDAVAGRNPADPALNQLDYELRRARQRLMDYQALLEQQN